MRFKLLGIPISVNSVKGAELAEVESRRARQRELLAEVPRLRETGLSRTGGIGLLISADWTSSEIESLLDAWSGVSVLPLTALIAAAGRLRESGMTGLNEIIAWANALTVVGPGNHVEISDLVKRELNTAGLGRNAPAVVSLYEDATGSRQAGLAALVAGLTVAEARGARPASGEPT